MKILYYSDSHGKSPFIHVQVVETAKHHEVKYACILNLEPQLNKNYEVIKLPYKRGKLMGKIWKWLELHDWYWNLKNKGFKDKLTKLLRSFRPDIIHCQFGYDAVRLLDHHFDNHLNYIINFRGYDASNKLMSKIYCQRLGYYLSKKNVFSIFVSKSLENNLRDHGIVGRNAPLLLYSNTDTYFFRRHAMPPKTPFIFIQISSFREKKGIKYTIKSFAKFIKKCSSPDKYMLTFTGFDPNNPQCQKMEALAKKEGVSGQIHFLGWVDRNEVKNLLEKSHVAVLHSYTTFDNDQEGVPNFLMEAMSMELPVLSTYHSGIIELVKNPENGKLVEEKDIEAFANTMFQISKNWKLYPNNRKIIEERFSKECHFKRLFEFYESVQKTN